MQEKLTVVSAFQEYMILDKELIVYVPFLRSCFRDFWKQMGI